MKHKHYDMICAKAANMDLVVLLNIGNEWVESLLDAMIANEDSSFFLCLPQHKDACLHWLNGGSIQNKYAIWVGVEDCNGNFEWSDRIVFMLDTVELRIKPSKEKRWIAIRFSRGVSCALYESELEARNDNPHADQFVEIEVEVIK